MNTARYSADGSALQALNNIVVTLDVLLSEEMKTRVNWYEGQNIHLVVMRLVSELNDLTARMEGLEK